MSETVCRTEESAFVANIDLVVSTTYAASDKRSYFVLR